MNKKYKIHVAGITRRFLWLGITIAALAMVALPALAEPGSQLNLADRPLLGGTNVPPNVMVAIDDSGSMDSEVVTPASDGAYYWNRGGFVTNGTYNNGPGNKKYIYLFPNGCNNRQKLGRRSQCESHDPSAYAIPPIPQLGYTRSPDYNKAYFNPAVTYEPWIGHEDAWKINPGGLTAIPYSPQYETATNTIDLTSIRNSSEPNEVFQFQSGMTYSLPPTEDTKYLVCFKPPNSTTKMTGLFQCPDGYEFKWAVTITIPGESQDVGSPESKAAAYYPATFYIPASNLPSSYSAYTGDTSVTTDAPVTATHPEGETLVRYQIKPENFSNQRQYEAAIHNFANWFTYYRKRHLATRGGIVAAFDQIGEKDSVRAGSCTINNPRPLHMRDLDNENDRQAFFSDIFDIDFSISKGTPNREALAFLGRQLETNPDIIQSTCQKNYAILFTDGYNSGSVSSFDDPDHDGNSNTIADVAMRYYENLGELTDGHQHRRNDIDRYRMRIPPSCDSINHDPALDCEKDLHMNTFGVTLGQSGTIYNGDGNNPDPYIDPPNWSKLNFSGQYGPEQIDDLWHATVNGHGKLLNAQTPQELADAFAGALKDILNVPGGGSAVAVNSASIQESGLAFRATYQDGSASGDLKSYPMTGDTMSSTAIWSAAEQLSGTSGGNGAEAIPRKNPYRRQILTSIPQRGSYKAAAFEAGSLSNVGGPLKQILSLDQSPLAGLLSSHKISDTDIVDYIRGERRMERGYGGDKDGVFRNRGDNILGDIVHSSPVYVAGPDRYRYPEKWQDALHPEQGKTPENGTPYSDPSNDDAFAQKNTDREKMVYVGANDGMLHGFDAQTGDEKIAYIPGAVLPHLGELADPGYPHRFYVDATPAEGDVFFGGAWHTILVGGERNGGNSIYALDITNPDQFADAESNPIGTVLWEYSAPELGQTYGEPAIVRLHNGQWAAVFGNGYNSESGKAQLFIVDIATGNLILQIDTGAGPTEENRSNGLGEVFPVDLDRDYITDYIYAGDLDGNVWQFDLSGTTPNQDWHVGHDGHPLYTAKDSNGNIQPITTQPQVGVHAYGTRYGVMVYFGTGKFIENEDAGLRTDVRNSLYGIWDPDVFTAKSNGGNNPMVPQLPTSGLSRSDLVHQSVLQAPIETGDKTYRVVSNNPVTYPQSSDGNDYARYGDNNDCNYSNGRASSCVSPDNTRGWVLDMPKGTGELLISNPRLQGTTISFSTTIPNQQACMAGGSGYFMVVDQATGGRTGYPAIDLNGDHHYNDADKIDSDGKKVGVSGVMIKNGAPSAGTHLNNQADHDQQVTMGTSDGGMALYNIKPSEQPDGRRSWREIRR